MHQPSHENVQSVQEVRVQAAQIVHEIQVVELYTPPVHPYEQGNPYSSGSRHPDQDPRHFNETTRNRSMLGGGFKLELEGYSTKMMNASESPEGLIKALEALPPSGGAGSITCNRTKFSEIVWVDGTQRRVTAWAVTFKSRGGDVQPMVADSSSLTWGGTHNDDVAVVVHTEREGATGSAESEIQVVTTSQAPMMSEIQELTIEGHPLQYEVQKVFVSSGSEIHSDSTFQLSYNARTTTSIPHDATAAQVRAAIQGVAGTGDVKVTRHRTGTRGYKWMITFLTTPHAGRPTMSMSASLYDVGTGGSRQPHSPGSTASSTRRLEPEKSLAHLRSRLEM